jgi:hypothetical protein
MKSRPYVRCSMCFIKAAAGLPEVDCEEEKLEDNWDVNNLLVINISLSTWSPHSVTLDLLRQLGRALAFRDTIWPTFSPFVVGSVHLPPPVKVAP